MDYSADEHFLAIVGATRPKAVRGPWSEFCTIFGQQWSNGTDLDKVGDTPGLALPRKTQATLRYLFREVFAPVHLGALSSALRDDICDLPKGGHVINASSGKLDFAMLYAHSGASGDLKRQLAVALRDPWDAQKLWLEPSGAMVRLHQLVWGDFAVLSPAFLSSLPHHLTPFFFDQDGLTEERAVAPDMWGLTDQDPAFIATLVQGCNHCITSESQLDLRFQVLGKLLSLQERSRTSPILRGVCDGETLEWCLWQSDKLLDLVWETNGRAVVPLEGAAVLALLTGLPGAIPGRTGTGGKTAGDQSNLAELMLSDARFADMPRSLRHGLQAPYKETYSSFRQYLQHEAENSPNNKRLGPVGSFTLSLTVLIAFLTD